MLVPLPSRFGAPCYRKSAGGCLPGGVCPGGGGVCLLLGVCLLGGCLPRGGVCEGGWGCLPAKSVNYVCALIFYAGYFSKFGHGGQVKFAVEVIAM